MKRKWLAVGIILLFIGIGIIPSTAQDTKNSLSFSDGKWLYVGGNGPGNFTKIQDAIDNASTGDTVYVYSGTYNVDFIPKEHCCVLVSKSIHLIGENKYTTIINGIGRYAVVSVKSGVTISGFTIQNGGWGINIQLQTNIKVSNMIVCNNDLAITFYGNSNSILENITLINNNNGISFAGGRNCTISHCIFNHAGNNYAGSSCYILHNVFTNDSSIAISNSENITIESNLFENNTRSIGISQSNNINICKNNFINNTKQIDMSKYSLIRDLPTYSKYHQHWMNNYWDDWSQNGSYPIPGTMDLEIGIPFFWDLQFFLIEVHILYIHYTEYDSAPAQEPYDIP